MVGLLWVASQIERFIARTVSGISFSGSFGAPLTTNANVRYWLYQHAWIVTGASFGWWHGAAALRTLIVVDQRAEAQWGIGKASETTARKALAVVLARSK